MKELLAYIAEKKQSFAELPFFEFLRDPTIHPQQKLAFAPCVAPFAMGFSELNKRVFRQELTTDPIQKMINRHTYEDDHHWLWFLEDLQRLELNPTLSYVEALELLWSDEMKASRQVVYELYHHTVDAAPWQRIVVIEVVETTGNVMLSVVAPVTQALRDLTHRNYLYFGAEVHLAVETGHTTGTEVEVDIATIALTEAQKEEALKLIDHFYDVFTNLTHAMLAYAKAHPVHPVLQAIETSH